jgi:hypothetical protein
MIPTPQKKESSLADPTPAAGDAIPAPVVVTAGQDDADLEAVLLLLAAVMS